MAAIAAACAYARNRLTAELPAALTYHSLAHTEQIVAPAATALAIASGVDEGSRGLLEVAAWFHDVGYIVRYDDNESVAVDMVREVLPGLGLAPAEVDAIEGMIWATRLPQRPTTLLEELMADADLDAFGHAAFWELQVALRAERTAYGRPVDEQTWIDEQMALLGAHTYFTAVARARNDAAKAAHLRELEARRDELRSGS